MTVSRLPPSALSIPTGGVAEVSRSSVQANATPPEPLTIKQGTPPMPLIDKTQSKAEANERNEGRGAGHAATLLTLGAARGVTPADLFCSLAAMVMRQNPNLGGKLLDALELSVRQRPEVEVLGGPLGNVTETASPTVTVTAPEAYCGPFDDTCHTPEACKAGGCARNRIDPPADVAFEAPANAATAAV